MSNKINIENYELYALDFIEGTLSEELKEEFSAFLLLHPEIEEELEGLKDLEALEPVTGSGFDASKLKVEIAATENIDETNYESFFIGEVEGNLTPDQIQEVEDFTAKNPIISRDRDLYKKTILRADAAIVYPEKGALRKTIPLWQNAQTYAFRAAAILLVALGGITIWNAIDQQRYLPRNRDLDYTLMETAKPMSTPVRVEKAPQSIEEVNTPSQEVAVSTPSPSVTRTDVPLRMQSLDVRIDDSGDQSLDSRSMLAYQPSVSKWVEPTTAQNKGQALNLAQFIGKEVAGVDPNKATTAKEVIREGFIKAVDDRENLALTASDPSENKKSVEFLAGNFGFKRVRYK